MQLEEEDLNKIQLIQMKRKQQKRNQRKK